MLTIKAFLPGAISFKMQAMGYMRGSCDILRPAGVPCGVPGCGCLMKLSTGLAPPDPQQPIGCWLWAICVAGVVLYRASPHPPRHFVVDVFLVLLVFLSVGLLYLPSEMFSKSMFFGYLPGFVVGVCFVSVTKT